MKALLKNILTRSGVYYFLQGNYRRSVSYLNILRHRFRYAKYKGQGYTCNFCQGSYTKFAPRHPAKSDEAAIKKYNVVAGKGENVYCPYCMSTARQRLVLQVLKDRMDVEKKEILHISPEKNIYNYLRKKARIVTIDIVPGYYKIVDKHVRFADVTNLPFENETFDIVIGNHIMEHIPGDRKAMQEIYRVLKHSGRAVLQVPFSDIISSTMEEPGIHDPAMQSALFGQKDHVRIYSLEDYISRLRKAGFEVRYITSEMLNYGRYAVQPGEGFIEIIKK